MKMPNVGEELYYEDCGPIFTKSPIYIIGKDKDGYYTRFLDELTALRLENEQAAKNYCEFDKPRPDLDKIDAVQKDLEELLK